MSLSERLRDVREGMKLTLEEVSQRTELGVSTLSEFENGRREPRLGQLKRLAEAYHRPVTYFLDDSVPPAELVLWRERPASPTAEEVQARLIELADQYHSLEVLCEQPTQLDLPWEKADSSRYGYSEAGRLARRVRNDLGLGERPGHNLLNVLEEVCNVKVFHLDFEPSGSAACSVAEHRYGAAVLLNARNMRWRRNFDLAHELFHILTWNVFRQGTSGDFTLPSPREEKLANCFASNLLMPGDVFRDAVDAQRGDSKSLGFDGLFEVARE
ncbi:MAG TPA: XRE family transcriptional regulator, partial [Isosphaeraceae bacterium]|nr:XRE family transcriptional regulator [Isosphaeraceae bacterium]